MMQILICSHLPVSKSLGATKVLAEAAEALRDAGCECTLIGPENLRADSATLGHPFGWFAPELRRYLIKHAANYDVVDYDHVDLPYPREEFPSNTLMVARSVLLLHHLLKIDIPYGPTIRQRVGSLVRKRVHAKMYKRWVSSAQHTVQSADLVNVSNEHDRHELHAWGIADQKIVVLPYGIGHDRRAAFDNVLETAPAQPRVVFVGTFDYRKGAREMPELFHRIAASVPDVTFDLLGVAGMFNTVAEVLHHFPRNLRSKINVELFYAPEELPTLLGRCSVGIFPSWLEGFGIGVLEMMAAAIPVIAYDAPGPPEMVSPAELVAPGDVRTMANKVVELLTDYGRLQIARRDARKRSRNFNWKDIGVRTRDCYLEHLDHLRAGFCFSAESNL